MSKQSKSLLVVTTSKPLPPEQIDRIRQVLQPVAEQCGMQPMVVGPGTHVGVHSDLRPLLEQLVAEQVKTNELLGGLAQSLNDLRQR